MSGLTYSKMYTRSEDVPLIKIFMDMLVAMEKCVCWGMNISALLYATTVLAEDSKLYL